MENAFVVLDSLTNDVRAKGERGEPAVTPQLLVHRVGMLREKLMAAGANEVVVCQLKPMQVVDVRPFNYELDLYLRALGARGFGCRTQIRLADLKGDGYHILPQFDSVIDRTYACAIMGTPVPRPTPMDGFEPDHVRHRRHEEWPRLVASQGGGWGDVWRPNHGHGWR